MRVRLLGDVHVERDDGVTVLLGAAKERSLVAALALAAGTSVSADTLISSVWGEEPPRAARKTLQTYVWNLRHALGGELIETDALGYRLRIDREDVDVHRFRALVRAGDEAIRSGGLARGRAVLAEALGLWRGLPFTGVPQHPGLAAEAVRLVHERLAAVEVRIAADLACGMHTDVIGELEALVEEHPFRERLWGHLMVALYRTGRQADALAAYQRVRSLLVDELGIEPGGELRRIEAAILRHEIEPDGRGAAAVALGTVRPSPVRYARAADGVHVAYQVAGTGPVDILAIPGFIHHLDIWWNAPTDLLVRRLTSMGRLTVFDKRGMGLSDRPDAVDLDGWTLDATAVLDAAGVERAVLFGVSAGSLTAIQLAAACPERVSALVLFGGYARQLVGPDYDIGHDPAVVDAYARNLEAKWGTGVAISSSAPSRAREPGVRDYWARYQRLSASPTAAVRFLHATTEADVRSLLPSIRVPTLVLHAAQDVIVPVAQARYVAERIPGAELVVLDSDVHLICVSDVLEELADRMEGFIAGLVPTATSRAG